MISNVKITDIAASKSEPTNAFNLSNSNSAHGSLTVRYPDDLMSGGQGHYMLFNIFVQEISKLSVPGNTLPGEKNANAQYIDQSGIANGGTGIETVSKVIGNAVNNVANFIQNKTAGTQFGNDVNKFYDAVKSGPETISELGKQTATTFNNNVVKLRKNIAIYMPDTVQFSSTASYDTQSLSGDLLSMLGVATSLVEQYRNGDKVAKSNAISALLGAVKNKFGSSIPILNSQTFNAAFIGKFGVVNPMVEVMYSKPELRNFRFDYIFYPRSESEARSVQDIIYQFQYHQAPELKSGTAGYMLVPPSTFDIGFYYRGVINPNIPRILSCVLKQVDVDYAPNGFHAFESDNNQSKPILGGTGMPVGIRLSLAFQETQYVTKQFMDGEKVAQAQKEPTPSFVDANGNNITVNGINSETGQPTVVTLGGGNANRQSVGNPTNALTVGEGYGRTFASQTDISLLIANSPRNLPRRTY